MNNKIKVNKYNINLSIDLVKLIYKGIVLISIKL